MYLFFMISGFLFVTGLSVLLKFIYEIFPINKITNFLSPTEESVFNNIGKVIIPNILWALIEVSLLGSNYYFLLGFILNIFVSMSTIYVIEYGYRLIINKNKNNNLTNIISIITGSIFGFSVNYLCLLIGVSKDIKMYYSVIGILLFIIIYIIIKLFPPKSNFFKKDIS